MNPKTFRFLPSLLLLAGALAGTGCAVVPSCPGEGGPDWRELRSDHFVLSTDMRAGKARDALEELETLRAAVLNAAFPVASRQPTGQIPVVIVDDIGHWEEYFPHNGGMFTHALWSPLIVMYGGNSLHRADTIKHELVHYLSRFYLPKQPRWFAEGLATFFETLEYDAGDKEVSFGRPVESKLRSVHLFGIMPLPGLLGGHDFFQQQFYASSWLLMHYLANTRPKELFAYQRQLQVVDEKQAWQQVFGGPEVYPALTNQLVQYLKGGRYLVLTNHFNPPAVNVVERTHSDAEAHVQRALLHYIGSNTQRHEAPGLGKALRNVEEALRQQPLNVLALAVRHYLLDVPVDEAVARAAVGKHPDDWRAWAVLSGALAGTPAAAEGKAALERAKQLATANPAVSFDLNWRRYH